MVFVIFESVVSTAAELLLLLLLLLMVVPLPLLGALSNVEAPSDAGEWSAEEVSGPALVVALVVVGCGALGAAGFRDASMVSGRCVRLDDALSVDILLTALNTGALPLYRVVQ